MALAAGAERIFALMDEEPEQDEGYVTLVNAHVNPDRTGTIHADQHRSPGPGNIPTRRTAP